KVNDDESIDAFARRRAGDEVANKLVDAFVTGIFAGDPSLLSMPATLPRIATYEREHGSVSRGLAKARKQRRAEARALGEPHTEGTRIWSFRPGLGALVEQVSQRLRQPPITGVAIRSVHREGDRWLVRGDGEERWQADIVALTCPGYQQAQLLADLDVKLA